MKSAPLRILLAIVVLLALADGVSQRWLTSPSAQSFDPDLGWKWTPGATIFNSKEGGARLAINSHGLNDVPVAERMDRPRLLGLGNSFMEAIQVPQIANFTSRTEVLADVDFVNLGRSAMSPAHYPLLVGRFAHLSPKMLVVAVGQGDYANLMSERTIVRRDAEGKIISVRPVLEAKDSMKDSLRPLLSRSALATLMMRRLKPIVLDWVSFVRGGDSDADESGSEVDGAEVECGLRLAWVLNELKKTAPVVLLDIPHLRYQADRKAVYASAQERRAYREAARLAGVPVIDAGPDLQAAYRESGQPGHGFANHRIGEGHLNEAGHIAVAQAMTRYLKRPPAGPPAARPPRATSPPPLKAIQPTQLSAVWAGEGGDKVTRDELRATRSKKTLTNSAFNGQAVQLKGAKNEVVNFNLVLEAGESTAREIRVEFEQLRHTSGAVIGTKRRLANGVFDYRGRNIELFFVRYLQIKGLSALTWGNYDERHTPERFRRKHDSHGIAKGKWSSRPDADKFYPDIAVPLELHDHFEVPKGMNQSIWADIYIPKTAAPGLYEGALKIIEKGKTTWRVPVALRVRKFTLPDTPHNKTMIHLGYSDVNQRYLGVPYPTAELNHKVEEVRDRHFQMAHRHKLSLIDANHGPDVWKEDSPRPSWLPRLDGSLFTAKHKYDGPGVGVGSGIFSIGTYGSWTWQDKGEAEMHRRADNWATWFSQYAPKTEYFLYLIDESSDTASIEKWSKHLRSNPGPGAALRGLATIPLPSAAAKTPSLDIPTSALLVGIEKLWAAAAKQVKEGPRKQLYMYNGGRPASGTLALEDDGIALRQIGWVHQKFDVDRWFYWESTYYKNYQGGTGETNVFQQAQTFGGKGRPTETHGLQGWNYTNGDGVLFYPGTDKVFPNETYGLSGPIASLRLKYLRRGVQDGDYIAMAAKKDPARVKKLIAKMVPKVLWEVGVDNKLDPTYRHTDISWSTDPDDWEAARETLAEIIEGP